MDSRPRILSIQVGEPRRFGTAGATDPADRPWTSAIVKRAVSGPTRVHSTHVDGDRQADLQHHGGPDKAVLMYSEEHYPQWCRELPGLDLPHGAFGENLTVSGITEAEVAIGDIWEAGSVILQVTQPRQPCWKLARHLRVKDMVARVQETRRSGWYCRVLREGEVRPGDALSLAQRPHPGWTVAEASRVMYGGRRDVAAAMELAGLEPLSASWKRALRLRASGVHVDTTSRVEGPDA